MAERRGGCSQEKGTKDPGTQRTGWGVTEAVGDGPGRESNGGKN